MLSSETLSENLNLKKYNAQVTFHPHTHKGTEQKMNKLSSPTHLNHEEPEMLLRSIRFMQMAAKVLDIRDVRSH